MVRKRIEGTALNSFDEVDVCLKEIGQVDRELGLIEAWQNEQIDLIKAQAKEQIKPLAGKKTGLEMAIKEYCTANRVEFDKLQTKALTFGEVGFRKSTKIAIKSIANTLQLLKDFALTGCIRIKEEPDKEAMKNLTDEQLADVGAAKKIESVFGYTVNIEKIQEAA